MNKVKIEIRRLKSVRGGGRLGTSRRHAIVPDQERAIIEKTEELLLGLNPDDYVVTATRTTSGSDPGGVWGVWLKRVETAPVPTRRVVDL